MYDFFQKSFSAEEAARNDEEVTEWELEQDARQIEHAIMHCGASPSIMQKVGWNNWKVCGTQEEQHAQQVMKNISRQFQAEIKQGKYFNLIMCGKPGIGKTFTALSILKDICCTQKDLSQYPKEWNLHGYMYGLYETSDRLASKLKDTSCYSSRYSRYELIKSYTAADLLVIDEIGRSERKDEKDALFAVIDARYQEEKPCILITNLDEAAFSKILGEALVDRLSEACFKPSQKNLDSCPNIRRIKALERQRA